MLFVNVFEHFRWRTGPFVEFSGVVAGDKAIIG